MGQTARKSVFTTGEVARMLGVNINTVIKWFEDGKLTGFRLPGSNDRRIPAGSLKEFMQAHKIPSDLLNPDGPMRRKYERIALDNPVEVYLQGKSEPLLCYAKDISRGGIGLRIGNGGNGDMNLGDGEITCRISDGELSDVQFAGKVVYMRNSDHGWFWGMSFNEDLNPQTLDKLDRFLTTHSI